MTRRQKTTFTPQVDGLERREVLSTVIHFSIPFVFAPTGVSQSAINFTSSAFHQVWTSLNADASKFARTGNLTNFETQVQALAGRVPYGPQVLLNTWVGDLSNATPATAGTVLHQMETDLLNYVDRNEGSAFNVLKSVAIYFTDGFLAFNGRAGHFPPIAQPKVIGVTAT
jgi:hypothetical protein